MIIASPPRCHFYSCWLKRFNGLVTGVPHLIDTRQRVLKHLHRMDIWYMNILSDHISISHVFKPRSRMFLCVLLTVALMSNQCWAGKRCSKHFWFNCLSSCCLMFNVFSRGTSNSLYILSWVLKGNKETQTDFKCAMITYILILC